MARTFSLALCCLVVSAASSIGRELADQSGKHQIEATLVERKSDSVQSKRSDGTIVRPRLDQRSQANRDFLTAEAGVPAKSPVKKSPPAAAPATAALLSGVTTCAGLESLAKKQTTAAAVVTLYQLFLQNPTIDKVEKEIAREQLPHWEDLKSADAVRVGSKWHTAAELEAMRGEEERLVVEATKLLETGNGQLAESKLVAASKTNPVGITATFLLGLYHALVARSSGSAEKDFAECVRRLKHKDSLSNEDRANLLASLNNLAIVEARQRKHGSAVKHWKEAARVAPPPIEVIQNVGRFVHLARAEPMLGISKDAEKSAGNLFASVASSAKGKSFSNRLGWLYIGVFAPDEKTDGDPAPNDDPPPSDDPKQKRPRARAPGGAPIVAGFGSGFVIQPGHVVTNYHVVEGADELEIHTRRNQAVGHKARVLAVSPKEDIALVECPELTAAPVPLSLDPPKLASDLLVLGYPEPERIGTQLKSVRGSVSGLPDPNVDNLLLYDALINAGSSGGPVCDQRGRVIALNRLYFLLANKIGGGVPAASVLAFLKRELPAFVQPPASPVSLDWSDVAETVGESTVLIVILKSPAKLRAIAHAAPKRKDTQSDVYAFEDPWCMFCNGSGEVDCPSRDCARGTVRSTTTSVVGTNPATGERILSSVETEVRCPTCGGKGHVPCKHCDGGIDPTVLGGRTR
ncbi:MAG TPA: trypsin-like peptidase domain-containing protein [Pirellulales bacterium]|jgi:S1-C subfamily serine protease|nr:trypsin-like peptidase domain-containing protein [Pirellulales bacterium]